MPNASSQAAQPAENILVIKHGALGDVILAQSPFQAIRKHHPKAKITLLTTKPFASFLQKSGLFDEIWTDDRPKLWHFKKLFSLINRLRSGDFNRVYDLQTSTRSNSYFRFFQKNNKPEWCGIAKGCSHPHLSPLRTKIHTIERHVDQLGVAGIYDVPTADFSWANTDISKFNLPKQFALLVPGGSAHRPEKRWPASKFAALASNLNEQDVTTVLIGGGAEAEAIAEIRTVCPNAVDLSSQTELGDIAALGNKAHFAIGNDTGPLHLISAVGCSSIVLFSNASDPHMSRPRGRDVTVLQKDNLADLSLEEVLQSMDPKAP